MDEEQNEGQQSQGRGSRGGLRSKLKGVEDKAKEVQKGANNRSEAHKKKAAQKGNKAKDLQGKASQGGKGAAKAGQKASKATKQAAKHAKKAEKMAKVAAKAGKVATAASKLAAIVSTVGIVLLIIIAIIGILVFIITGFGLIMKGLQDLVDGFMDYMESLWGGEENIVETAQIAGVLSYLEEMDYDLYGFGFVTKENSLVDADEEIENELIKEFGSEEKLKTMRRKAELVDMNVDKIEEKGKEENWTEAEIKEAKKWKNEEKQKAKDKIETETRTIKEELKRRYGNDNGKVLGYKSGTADFDEAYRYIIPYLISDNYAKCIKNNNKNFKTAFASFDNFVTGMFSDNTAWGSGLLSIYHEESVGKRGKAFGLNGVQETLKSLWAVPIVNIASGITGIGEAFEGDVDVSDDGYLVIKGKGVFSHDIMKYKIDGWIGRYGMPVEFLLATHIATMAPDVSLKLATQYSTDVEVLLHESNNGTVKSAVKIDGTQITQEEIEKAKGKADEDGIDETLAVFKYTKLESYTGNDTTYKCQPPRNMNSIGSSRGNGEAATQENIAEAIETLLSSTGVEINDAATKKQEVKTNVWQYFQQLQAKLYKANVKFFAAPEGNQELNCRIGLKNSNQNGKYIFTVTIGSENYEIAITKYKNEADYSIDKDYYQGRTGTELIEEIEAKGYAVPDNKKDGIRQYIQSIYEGTTVIDCQITVQKNTQDNNSGNDNLGNNGNGVAGGDKDIEKQISFDGKYNGSDCKFIITVVIEKRERKDN